MSVSTVNSTTQDDAVSRPHADRSPSTLESQEYEAAAYHPAGVGGFTCVKVDRAAGLIECFLNDTGVPACRTIAETD